MTSIKDYIKVELINESNEVTRELFAENTVKNPTWYTVEDNNVSLISENVEKVVNIETDILEDCVWETSIEIPKVVNDHKSLLSSLEYQNVSESSDLIYTDCENDNHVKTFCCNVCRKAFNTSIQFENHMDKHKKLAKVNDYKCDFCEKTFKLNFGLNRHVQKYHLQNNSNRHESGSCAEKKTDCILNLKLCKLNGVWKSKPNFVYKCNVCFEKFHSENNLMEHVKIHDQDNGQIQCEVCLKVILVSELNYHMKLIHSKNPFACLKCNLRFDKKQNLKRHFHRCTKRSLSKFQSKHKNAVKALFVCTVCRIGFSSSFRLKFHIISGCKYRSFKYGRKTFSAKNLWSKHMYEYGKYKKCVNINKTSVNEIYNENMIENNCRVDIKNNRPYTNVSESSSSNNMDLGTDHESTVQAASIDNVLVNNCIMKVTEDNSVGANVTKNNNSFGMDGANSTEMTMQITACNSTENDSDGLSINGNDDSSSSIDVAERIFSDQIDVANSNESVLETLLPHNSTVNNYNAIAVKIERNEFANFTERNDLDSVGVENDGESIEPGVSHSLMIDYCRPIKVEKIVSLNDTERNSLNCAANDIELPVVMTVPLSRIVNMKQEPNDIVNDDAVNMVSSASPVLCTRKLSNTEIVERPVFDGLSNIVFTCKVCDNSTNDRHTFALHMSCHSNSNLYECVVCDKKFSSEYLWQKHLMFHREKQHLILMSSRIDAQFNNTTDFTRSNIHAHNNAIFESRRINQVTPKIKRKYNNSNANVMTNLNNEAKQIQGQFFCSICENVFPSKLTLIAHQTAVHISCMFFCRHCDRAFSTKGSCTNHEKSHKLDTSQQPLLNTRDSSFEPNKMPYDIEPENNDDRPIKRIYRKKNNKSLKTNKTFCNICKRKFTKQCYWTNHMKLLHKINPNLPKEQQQVLLSNSSNVNDNVNGEKCIDTSETLEERRKRPSAAAVDKTLSSSSNNIIRDKSSYCTICMKQFAHIGALTSHMHIHSDLKPYECRYCSRKFSMKGPFTIHEKTMKCVKDGQQRSYSENSLARDSLQTENYNCELVDGAGIESTNDTHFVKRKRVWFECDVCDKKFSTPDKLIIHRKLHRGNEPFLCKICNKSYAYRCHWNRHLKSHYLKNNTLVKTLKSHQQTDNANLGTYNVHANAIQHESKFKCVYCKKGYNLMSHLKKHLSLNKECRRHGKMAAFASTKAKNDIRRKCKICLKTYSTAYNCKVHMINVHKHFDTEYSDDINVESADGGTIGEDFHDTDAENSHDIDAEDVDVETTNPMLLKPVLRKPIGVKKRRRRRRQQIAEDENRHQCDICKKSYSNKTNLSRHHNQCHTLDVHINCNICGINFRHNYSYQQHMRYRHKILEATGDSDVATNITVTNVVSMNKNYIEKYSCAVCKMAFADDNAFQTHKKTHAMSGYVCNDCGQRFETNVTLGEHILQSHYVNVATNDNNKRAENDGSIPNYLSSSAGPSESQRKIYPKVLKTDAHLSNRAKLLSGVKLFKCGRCDAAFKFKQNLIVHKRKHYLESRLAGECEVLS